MMNNSLEACVLTYVKHQRAACHEQNSPARTTIRQVYGYYHIRSYPSMMATTSDNQLFGTNQILKTVESVKMIQKLLREVRIRQENGYDSPQCFEPREPIFSRGTECKE